MACIEVFAAGDCLARTAGGRTGRRGSLTLDLDLDGVSPFTAWRNRVTT